MKGKKFLARQRFGSAILLLAVSLLTASLSPILAQPVDLEEQTRIIASELRCVVCQNLSVADSPSELAQQMRAVVREQLREGKSPEQIKAYFVSKYGEWVLLAPTPKGLGLLVWVLPFAAVGGGILFVVFVTSRWTRKKNRPQPQAADPKVVRQLREEVEELEFDFQAGKLSETDYQATRLELEAQVAMVEKHLQFAAPTQTETQPVTHKTGQGQPQEERVNRGRPLARRWPLVAGGAFLLLFGITLGLLLTKSLRPRLSGEDTLTGDFLTGAGRGKDVSSLVAQGRASFEQQDWPKAIEAFKAVLVIDPNHPEAHTYMGFILAQAGHADGALLAFDRALASRPDFPLALWGKGMLLYRAKEDLPGAREAFEKLVSLVPAGTERDEIEKILDELKEQRGQEKGVAKPKNVSGASRLIEGVISVDPKVKAEVKGNTVLFVIAHSANSASGPPLAVKRVDRPVFPVTYSLGIEELMMPGTSFSGKVLISARLDRDGNPMTRAPGDFVGLHNKNPVEIGSKGVDVVIDRPLAESSP